MPSLPVAGDSVGLALMPIYFDGWPTLMGGFPYATPVMVSITLPDDPDNPPPTNLTAQAIDDHQIELTWDDNSSAESGYAIERIDNTEATPGTPPEWHPLTTIGPNITSLVVTSDAIGAVRDQYRVRAIITSESTGQLLSASAWSNTADATPFPAKPGGVPNTDPWWPPRDCRWTTRRCSSAGSRW